MIKILTYIANGIYKRVGLGKNLGKEVMSHGTDEVVTQQGT